MVGPYHLVYFSSFGVVTSCFPSYAECFYFSNILINMIHYINSIFFCPQVSRVSGESSKASVAVGVEAMALLKEGSESLEVPLQVS